MGKLIIANWKMNPATEEEAVRLAASVQAPNLVIAPPFVFFEAVRKVLRESNLGAQDIAPSDAGALTGEVSGSQLASLGVRYVIIGHSERRRKLKETDELIAEKVRIALQHSVVPVLCVGEERSEHDSGTTKEVIGAQLERGLSRVPRDVSGEILIAYEPVWAISTEPGATPDTPSNAVRAIQFLKERALSLRLAAHIKFLYGGSVNAANAAAFLGERDIEGALVGGASLNDREITMIADIAARV
jgi:triosephosphate isomerase